MTVRGWSVSAPGDYVMALPSGTADGDLLVLYAGGYVITPAVPTSGGGTWDSRFTGSGTGVYPDHVRLSTKVKAVGDTTVLSGNEIGFLEHSGAVLVALYDVDVADFFTAVGQSSGVSPITAPAGTPAEAGKRLSFISQMTDTAVLPVFTTPAGTTLGATTGSSSGFHRVSGYTDDGDAAAGVAVAARAVVSDQAGGNVGVTFVVYGGAPPAAVADAGPDQTVDEATTVTLDSTGSTDVASRAWSQLSGPSVTLSDATAAQPTFLGLEGTLVFRVTVSPGGDTDDVTVTVNAVAPPAMPSVTNIKHRSGGLFVARARRIKVGGSFVEVS